MAQKESTFGLMRQWMEINQDLWNNWLNTTRHLGRGPAGFDDAYHEHLKGLQHAVNDTIRLEHEWMRMATEQASANQVAQPAARLMANLAETTLDTRSRAWKAFFENAQAIDLSAASNSLADIKGPQDLFAALREMGDRLTGNRPGTAGSRAQKPAAEAAGQSKAEPVTASPSAQADQQPAGNSKAKSG